MKRFFLLLTMVAMLATACTESGVDENDEPQNPTEQPGGGNNGGNDDGNTDGGNDDGNDDSTAEEAVYAIYYTSSDGNVVEPNKQDVFGANLIGNNYKDNQGILLFDAPITSIGDEAFRDCTSLTSITIPDSVTSIGGSAFSYCTSLISITIPDSVTTIEDWAFTDCSSLTSITIPGSVITIGDEAFSYCSSLTSVTIGDGVRKIGNWAFINCSSLTSITIPDSVRTIGIEAFSYCSSLKEVYYQATTPPDIWNVFNNNASGRKIYVPSESVNAYKTAYGWSDYADDIVGYDFE